VPGIPPSGRAVVQDGHAIFTAAEPRAEIEQDNAQRLASRRGLLHPTPPRPFASIEPVPPPWELFPDEYLFDGGDRGEAVHDHQGLETEDAVAEYVDRSGARHILPTNRVAIYSPRFGNVGTATGLEAGVTVTGPASTVDRLRGQSVRNLVATTNQAQRVPSQSVRTRSRASGFAAEENDVGVKQRTALGQDLALAGSVEGVQSQVAPTLRDTERARIAKLRQAAIAWTRREYPIVTASLAGAQQIKAKFVVSEMIGLEVHRRRGRLEIVKLADKQTAQRGEIVNFTIEYENIGDTEVSQVQIIDNLTPRLEYVDQSGTSNRPATLNVSDNGEGSVILTWTLHDPLPGRTKGTVTFQARVR
jgi:uncharacterized repeat protein (TIGR01451 family)